MSDVLALSVFICLLGPCVGSFIGLCADRYPAGENVVSKRSFCRSCGTDLKPVNLVPILSFAASRGRCQTCQVPIPPRLLYLEIAAGGLGVLAVLAGGDSVHVLLTAALLWLLLALGTIDAAAFRLPDAFTASLAIIAVLRAPDVHMALWGAAIGAGSFAVLRHIYRVVRHREGLGLGDIKLMVGLGAVVGPLGIPTLVLVAALLAIAWVLSAKMRGKSVSADLPVPFGTALCASAMLLWVFGQV